MMPIRRTPACDECFDTVDLDLKAPIESEATNYAWMDAEDARSDVKAARILCVKSVMDG
jgi:hypothetical protein